MHFRFPTQSRSRLYKSNSGSIGHSPRIQQTKKQEPTPVANRCTRSEQTRGLCCACCPRRTDAVSLDVLVLVALTDLFSPSGACLFGGGDSQLLSTARHPCGLFKRMESHASATGLQEYIGIIDNIFDFQACGALEAHEVLNRCLYPHGACRRRSSCWTSVCPCRMCGA